VTKALIIANGDLPRPERLRGLVREADVVVAVDGGANALRRLKIVPSVILGDFDSITARTRAFYRNVPQIHMPDQESTDLEKALTWCLRRGIRRADIAGATGSRLDHEIGALGCFKRFGTKPEMRFVTPDAEITQVTGTASLDLKPGAIFSLIPLDRCSGIVTSGLKYPLKNEALETGRRDGISNEAVARRVKISVRKGTLLLYLPAGIHR
jgi:thiamine pyrophosphokinase